MIENRDTDGALSYPLYDSTTRHVHVQTRHVHVRTRTATTPQHYQRCQNDNGCHLHFMSRRRHVPLGNVTKNKTFVSMASRSVSGKMVELNGRGPQPFKMSGQMYHLTPSAVFPDTAKKPKFSQIYVFDQDNEIKTPSSR